MATCPRCTRKLNKRVDNWYHCMNCGPVRQVLSPIIRYTQILKNTKQTTQKINKKNYKTKTVSVDEMTWNLNQ